MSQHVVSPASHASLDSLDRRVLVSSRDAGWSSLLVERHLVRAAPEDVAPLPTPDQTVVVVTHGVQEILVVGRGPSRSAVYRPGSVGLTAGGEADTLRRRLHPGSASVEKVNVYVPEQTVAEAVEHLRRPGQRAARARLTALDRHDGALTTFASSLSRAAAAGAPELYASTAAQWLVVHLLTSDESREHRQRRERLTRSSSAQLAGVIDLLRTEYARPLTLDQLAAEAGISTFHFTRVFRAATGSSPHAYLLDVRIGAAKDLLVRTDLAVAEVGRRCGFPRPAHFSVAFAGRVGLPPTAYRRGARERAGLRDASSAAPPARHGGSGRVRPQG